MCNIADPPCFHPAATPKSTQEAVWHAQLKIYAKKIKYMNKSANTSREKRMKEPSWTGSGWNCPDVSSFIAHICLGGGRSGQERLWGKRVSKVGEADAINTHHANSAFDL